MVVTPEDIELLSNENIPELIRAKIAEQILSAGDREADRGIEQQRLASERNKSFWSTPIAAAVGSILTLSATFVFDRLTAKDSTNNTITLEQVRTEFKQSEARQTQELEAKAKENSARLDAGAKEREFQYSIVQRELADTKKSNADRAAILLFLVRAGILNSLNKDELISMAQQQQDNPSNTIIPPLAGNIDQQVAQISAVNQRLEAKLLAVPSDISAQFAEFLKKKDTGLIRLLPRGKYENAMLMRGGGAYYSFAKRTQEYGNGSDIELDRSVLSVGFAGVDYGFFLDLGKLKIAELGDLDESPPDWLAPELFDAWRYFFNYQPPGLLADARKEQRRFSTGNVRFGSATLTDHVPAIPSDTYLLRSIGDRESDVLVVFQVAAKLEDDSVVLAWRLTKSFPKPTATGPDLQE